MRTVVVGLGQRGRIHASIVGEDLVATVDPINSSASHTDIRDLELNKIDCAIICTPENTKFDLIYFFLKNQKHVLVEKPLLLTFDELKKLEQLANEKSVVLKVAYNLRFESGIKNLKEELNRRKLGNVYIVRGFYGNGTAKNIKNSEWRDSKNAVATDLLVHLIDLMYYIFNDKNLKIEYFRKASIENLGADDALLVGLVDQVIVTLEASYLSWQNRFSLQVVGEKGAIKIDGLSKWKNHNYEKHVRVSPSGPPIISNECFEVPHVADELQWEDFKENMRERSKVSLEKDIQIASVLANLDASFSERKLDAE